MAEIELGRRSWYCSVWRGRRSSGALVPHAGGTGDERGQGGPEEVLAW
jgi:hypothetical protein